jgi:DHA2 family methylenomycin A resistance protein-like MFS transporter
MPEAHAAPTASPAPAVAAGDEIAWLGLPRKWWVLAVATPSVALAEVAFTALLFSNIQVLQGLATDTYGYQWATGPYVVLLVLWALVSVRLAATFGSQRVFLAGAVMAGLGCVVASFAGSLAVMVIGRLLMSAKGLVLSVALSQMWLAFPRRKGLAMGVFNAATYGGLFIGAAVGGFLEFQTSWRAVYAVTGLAFLALAVAGNRALIRDRPAQPIPLELNRLETVLLAIALAVAVFLVFRGPYYGWFDSNLVAFSIAVGVAACAGFVWVALTSNDPLVNLRLGNFPTLALTLPVIAIFGGVGIGMLNTLPSYLNLRGYPSVVEGWIVFFPGVAIVLSCLASGFVYGRKWTVLTLWAGLSLNMIGGLWFFEADLYTAKETIVAMLIVWAMGAGLVFPMALRLTFSGQDPPAVRQLAGVKVALRFAATVVGSFAATLMIQRGTDTGQDLLRQQVTRNNPAYTQIVTRVEQHVASRGSPPAIAAEQASSIVGDWVAYHAQMTGQRAGRRYLLSLTAVALLLALFIRLRPETSILADDAHDLGWSWGRRADSRSVAPTGRSI